MDNITLRGNTTVDVGAGAVCVPLPVLDDVGAERGNEGGT